MGRPRKEDGLRARRRFDAARTEGLSVREASALAGVSERTGRRWSEGVRRSRQRLSSTSVTSFEGRTADLADVSRLFREGARLVTVLGAPGVGKTRLVLQWLETAGLPQVSAVHFCDLRQVREAGDLAGVLSHELDVQLASSAPTVESVGAVLAARGPLLLVFDNFEQLVDEGAAAVVGWLDLAPELRVVVTSRRALRVRAEVVHQLHPLPVPPEGVSAGAVLDFASVRLLWDRATAIEPDFKLDDATQRHLTGIVRRLDGVPLALELAAARLAAVGAAQLASEVQSHVLHLKSPWRDTEPRQASLARSVEGSWALLPPVARDALTQLTVFRGEFDFAAVEAVVRLAGEAQGTLTQALSILRESSLIRVVTEDGRGLRWDLLEVIREFAASQSSGRAKAAAELRHARYFARQGERWLAERFALEGAEGRTRLVVERGNLRIALETLVKHRGDPAATLRVATALHEAMASSIPSEAAELAARALDSASDATDCTELRVELIVLCAGSLRVVGRSVEARRWLDEATSLLGGANGFSARLGALVWLEWGHLHHEQGGAGAAQDAFQKSLAFALAAADRRLEAWARTGLGELLADVFGDASAIDQYEAAVELFRSEGDAAGLFRARYYLAYARWFMLGDDPRAEFEELLKGARSRKNHVAEGYGIFGLAILDVVDHPERALTLARQAYELANRVGHARLAAGALFVAANAKDVAGWDLADVVSTCDRAVSTLRSVGDRRLESFGALIQAGVRARQRRIHDATSLLDWADKNFVSEKNIRFARLLSLQRGMVDVGEAQTFRALGDGVEASRRLARGRERLMDVEHRSTPWTSATGGHLDGPEIRAFAHILRRELDAFETAESEVCVAADGSWFRVGGATPVPVGPSPGRLLLSLFEEKLSAPGSPVHVSRLIECCWPGEKMSPESGNDRVRNMVRRLRRAGLGPYLVTSAKGGYLFEASVRVTVAEVDTANR